MKEVFVINSYDNGLSLLLKREANIILASLDKESNEYLYKKQHFEEVLNVINAIESTNPQNEEDIDFILDTIKQIWNIGILSPLTLNDDEFSYYSDANGYFRNIRYRDIYKDNHLNSSICNDNAFNISIRNVYSHVNIIQEQYIGNRLINKNHCIYLSKGGVITGEYIQKCIIRPEIVNKHCFTIQSVINIPVSIIKDNDFDIFVVDHREPKLKVLKEFYDVPIHINENVRNKHYNIRKYKKLNDL